MKEDKETRKEIATMDSSDVGYLVLKLRTTVEVFGIETKLTNPDSLAGFSPIYSKESDAIEAAFDGKYNIIAVSIGGLNE